MNPLTLTLIDLNSKSAQHELWLNNAKAAVIEHERAICEHVYVRAEAISGVTRAQVNSIDKVCKLKYQVNDDRPASRGGSEDGYKIINKSMSITTQYTLYVRGRSRFDKDHYGEVSFHRLQIDCTAENGTTVWNSHIKEPIVSAAEQAIFDKFAAGLKQAISEYNAEVKS